jgi:hypothetical protein
MFIINFGHLVDLDLKFLILFQVSCVRGHVLEDFNCVSETHIRLLRALTTSCARTTYNVKYMRF